MLFFLLILSLETPIYKPTPADLPQWALDALQHVSQKTTGKADMITIIDHVHFIYKGDGNIEIQYKLLRKIQHESAAENASVLTFGHAASLTKLHGWHRRPSGFVERLKTKNIAILGHANTRSITGDSTAVAIFNRATKGSILAFEATEVFHCFPAPMFIFDVCGQVPVYQKKFSWEVDPECTEPVQAQIQPYGFSSWQVDSQKVGQSLIITLPPILKDIPFIETNLSYYPYVSVAFHGQKTTNFSSWDRMANWYLDLFKNKTELLDSKLETNKKENLIAFLSQMNGLISYRQIYLSKSRTWFPDSGNDVLKRGYGDCKDMVCAWTSSGNEMQIPVYPVFACIYEGLHIDENSPVGPWFNHLIAAIPLDDTLGMQAEVEVKGQRFLLVDPTSSSTKLGYLPSPHRNRKVLICTPSGALWVKVPDAAFEPTWCSYSLTGSLDKDLTFSGTLKIVELGNAYYLRSYQQNSTNEGLLNYLRTLLDLPHDVDLKITSSTTHEGDANMTCSVNWPAFLYQDAHGYRLPSAIVGKSMYSLKNIKNPRLPLTTPEMPEISWLLDIRTQSNFKPSENDYQREGSTFSLKWKTTSGKHLKIQLTKKHNAKTYQHDKSQDAVNNWEAFYTSFEHLRRFSTLFTKGSP